MKKAKPAPSKKIFEPVTPGQIEKIHARAAQIGLSEALLYAKVSSLIGIGSITSLSKQEASFIIDGLEGDKRWNHPPPPRAEDQIQGAGAELPLLSHVMGIRLIAAELGWDKEHFKNWLGKYMKVSGINALDRKRAKDVFLAMKNIQEHRKRHRRAKVQDHGDNFKANQDLHHELYRHP